jgi:hypothetical protein
MSSPAHESPAEAPAKHARRSTVQVRFSADEKRFIVTAANAAGLDAGAWLRFLALREARSAGGYR